MTNLEALVSISETILRVRGEWCVAGIDRTLERDIRNTVADVWTMMRLGDDTIIAEAIDELERRAIVLDRGLPFWYFECRDCGYDSEEAKRLSQRASGVCPLCAGDTGHDVNLTFRPATEAEIVRFAA